MALQILSVSVGPGGALLLERYNFRGVEFPLFLFAIAITVWYASLGPAVLALVHSSLAFDYFFTKPLHTSHEEKDMVASYKLGVNAYVVKPVDFHEFVNAVKELGIFWALINEPPPGSVKKN